MSDVREIPVEEVIASIATQYGDVARFEIEILQWIYECISISSEGEGFQRIGWKWENDGTWNNEYLAVPNDVVRVHDILHNGRLLIERTDGSKRDLSADEYYIDGPYIHFAWVPSLITGEVSRIKVNDEGSLMVPEIDALQCRNYVLWKIKEIEMMTARVREKYAYQREVEYFKNEYFRARRYARGDHNTVTSQADNELAQIAWNNMFSNVRKTW